MKTLMINDRVCISIEQLYKHCSHLSCGAIITDGNYYDLYSNGELVCCDGEEVRVISLTNEIVEFENENGENNTCFRLTREEAGVAIFN